MSDHPDAPAEHVLIIRRHGNDEGEGHHGGAWKIAYADFMTAMMAFFLVMWLINASNTETKAAIASYFNPIKLTDPTSRPKGLFELSDRDAAKTPQEERKTNIKPELKSGNKPSATGSAVKGINPDPLGLEEPAEGAGETSRPVGVSTAERFRQPNVLADPLNPAAPRDAAVAKAGAGGDSVAGNTAVLTEATEQKTANAKAQMENAVAEAAQKKTAAEAILKSVKQLANQVSTAAGPNIEVGIEGEYIVLSLTDTSNFGMFAVGSAEPNQDFAVLLQKIVPTILENSERIIIRGHTDARAYKGNRTNNWTLSTARAEAAYKMLARAGIPDGRVDRIEAYADRRLKTPAAPEAAVNRRIEILLRRSATR